MNDVHSEYDFSQIPIERIACLGQRSLLHNNLFCVSWVLHRFCNYRCSYCWPHGRSDIVDFRNFESICDTLNEIKKQARERGFNSFAFSFSGGEPSLHPHFLEIHALLAEDQKNCDYQSVHMTTNLYRSYAWFEKYLDIVGALNLCRLTASYHKEYVKDRTEFTKKLHLLQKHKVKVTINMVIPPKNFDVLWDDAFFFHEQNLNVTLKPQSDPKAQYVVNGYTKEQLELLKNGLPQRDYRNHPSESLRQGERPPQIMNMELISTECEKFYLDQAERLNALGFNSFTGWDCSAGHRSIVIREPGGEVKRSYSCQDSPLGSIDSGFCLHDKIRTCITPTCVSSADSKIPKRRSGFKWPLWPKENMRD